MSNPTITRLGINQFWYNHWLSSNNYSSFTNQDNINSEFIQNYINYGATINNNMFMHEYWYSKKHRKVRTAPSRSYMQFYRRHYYSNNVVGIEHSYLIRYTTGEYFPLRTWYLRYNNWLIIAIQWFKPDKTNKFKKSNMPLGEDVSAPHAKATTLTSIALRNKLQYSYILNSYKKSKIIYNF